MTTADPLDFERHLESLLASVKGVVRDAIQRTLGSHFHTQTGSVRENVDDLAAEAMLLLVRKVRELHTDGSLNLIQNFQAYAGRVASNVCYAYLRRRYPAWTRLKNQVRYVVTHDPELAMRNLENGTAVCVLKDLGANTAAGADGNALSLRDQIKSVLRSARGPLELNDLASAIADLRGIRDGGPDAAVASDELESVADLRPVGGSDDISLLKQVWDEVRQLPVRQRAALLLNLRDSQRRGVLTLLPITGIASIGQIAEVLEMPAEELARLWKDLPIEDVSIAERLSITRQQVINLRKAARARLARRIADHNF